MKKLITLILAISMMLSLSGCGYFKQKKIDEIKAQLLAGFSEDGSMTVADQNGIFDSLFEPFNSDYLISDITANNELKSIWRRGYLIGIDYVATQGSLYTFYSPDKEKMYQYYERGSVSFVGEGEADKDPTTLFEAFGVDISMFYAGDSGTDDGTGSSQTSPLRDMTADDLTVSDDFLTVTISQDYIKELARSMFTDSDDLTEKQQTAYLEKFYGEGTIDIEKQSFSIRFGSHATDCPKREMTMEITPKEDGSVNAVCTIKGEQEVDGEIIPIDVTMRMNNLKMVDSKPVKGDLEIDIAFSMDMFESTGVDMKMEFAQSYVVNVDVSDPATPMLTVQIKNSQKAIQGTETTESVTEQYMMIDTKKTEKQFVFREKRDGVIESEIIGKSIILGTHDKVAPTAVIQAHAKNSK